MNPLYVARELRDEYLRLLKTAFNPRQEGLNEAFNREIQKDGFLTREPFIALAQPHVISPQIQGLLKETKALFGPIAETPYWHQAEGCRLILEGNPVVVATGTGSGKTEAFLMPIIDHCMKNQTKPGVKAILIYPMNALANDQLKRIRGLLKDTNVTYGLYTRETSLWGERPADAPENEKVLRSEFRADGNQPHIILTNYMMLEYMLMRGDGRDIFKNHSVRHIVLDEVHTYHGLLGVDVSCLMRRLREALKKTSMDIPPPLFIGTSATLQAGDNTDPREGVKDFFTKLTGQEMKVDYVIRENLDTPKLPEGLVLPDPPDISEEELRAFDPDNAEAVLSLSGKIAGVKDTINKSLYGIWDNAALPYLLMDWLKSPLSETQIVAKLAERPERQGVEQIALRREIEAALLIGPCLPESHPVKLRPRVHRMLRGLARFWRCTNPDCGKLLGEGIEQCDECNSKALPLALCRTCGWDFFMAKQVEGGAYAPWSLPVSTNETVYLYDLPKEALNVEKDEDLSGGDDDETPEEQMARESDEEVDTTDATRSAEPKEWLDPLSLRAYGSPDLIDDDDVPVRGVAVHRGKGTKCPVCNSTYGKYDILGPVSLGNSSALAHISRVMMRNLPEEQRKLLVFCDSRQDAAHQARFITGIEEHIRMRRVLYQALIDEVESHDYTWVLEALYREYIRAGIYKTTKNKDQRRRDMAKIEGQLLNEFVISPKVRASVERLGLVKIVYSGFDDDIKGEDFRELCNTYGLIPEIAAFSVYIILNEMRHKRAITHETMQKKMFNGDELARHYGLTINQYIGTPVAFGAPGEKKNAKAGYIRMPSWNAAGSTAALQKIWRHFHGEKVSVESLEAVFQWLLDNEFIEMANIGSDKDRCEGFQLSLHVVEFEVGKTFFRCSVCDRMMSNITPNMQCPRAGCKGRMEQWQGPIEGGNLNALMAVEDYAPALFAAEHSAAVTDKQRGEIEEGFMKVIPPKPNLLACTPTLEMGVNIGDLEAVAMRNVPPNPANYAQRSGRTGRKSRMGIVAGFSRNTPHDGYFFDHPDEIISGAIPPPKFNLANLEALSRHVRSLILEYAALDFPSNLESFMKENGELIEAKVKSVTEATKKAAPEALKTAKKLWGDVVGSNDSWFEEIAKAFPDEIVEALKQRRNLIFEAEKKMQELCKVGANRKEEFAEKAYRNLAKQLRSDNKYAYFPRVLAEAGLLPGYSFPADPGSVSLGFDPDPIFGGRLQAQREFAPGQVIYARGKRWSVAGVALNRPGSGKTSGQQFFEFTLCGTCGIANPPNRDFCARCNSAIDTPDGAGLVTHIAWDAGAFQAWEKEVEAQSEEERMIHGFDIRSHPQRDVESKRYGVGPWSLELRLQESVWFINHGPKDVSRLLEAKGESPGFNLCDACGEYFQLSELQKQKTAKAKEKKTEKDSASRLDGHAKKCNGQLKSYALGHQAKADTLRLVIPDIATWGKDGIGWAWSFGYAMLQGAMRLFEIDEDDISVEVLTKSVEVDGGREEQVMDVIWVDKVIGGSGVLQRLADDFPRVATAALKHLDGHDCPNSCYRCLRSYRNQRVHKFLDWRLAVLYLKALCGETVIELAAGKAVPAINEGPEWDEARAEGCESPQELRLLKAIRADGSMPEPEKQYKIYDGDRILTRADFAYLDCDPKVIIYVDGLKWHSDIKQRVLDNKINNRLQMMGYISLRFLGTETQNQPKNCVEQIKQARKI